MDLVVLLIKAAQWQRLSEGVSPCVSPGFEGRDRTEETYPVRGYFAILQIRGHPAWLYRSSGRLMGRADRSDHHGLLNPGVTGPFVADQGSESVLKGSSKIGEWLNSPKLTRPI